MTNLRRLSTLFLILIFSLSVCACNKQTDTSSRKSVSINMPTDGTVNGYKTETAKGADTSIVSSVIPADKVTAQTQSTDIQPTEKVKYYANIKSKVFHKSDCGSAKNMNETNKYITYNREELLSDGYTPCNRCKP